MMIMVVLSPRTLGFLTHLGENNTKDWMDQRRDFYYEAKQEFIDFAQEMLIRIQTKDPRFAELQVKQCLFRINRDIRFARGMPIYKPWFAVYLAPGGKKSLFAGLYLHIQPGGRSLIAGGCYELDRHNLAIVRQHIVDNQDRFTAIIDTLSQYPQFSGVQGKKRATMPRGFNDCKWLLYDSWYVDRMYTDDDVVQSDFIDMILRDYVLLSPLNEFFNEVVDREKPLKRSSM